MLFSIQFPQSLPATEGMAQQCRASIFNAMIRVVKPIRAWVDACPHLVTSLSQALNSLKPAGSPPIPPPLPLLFLLEE